MHKSLPNCIRLTSICRWHSGSARRAGRDLPTGCSTTATRKQHGLEMANFVLDRGGEALVDAIDKPEVNFTDPKQVFELTLAHEQHVTELINRLADVADEEHDRASINFVDKFIDEQVEEEKSVRDILNLFRHRDGHTVATIDDIVGTEQAE